MELGRDMAALDGPTRVESDPTPGAELARGSLAVTRSSSLDWLKREVERSAGTKVGRYTLLRLLGEGGMGVVFVAYDEELDRKLAIKLLRPPRPGTAWDSAWLLHEAKAMARLSHPNIVQVYDCGEAGGQVFIAMEFVVGEPLREWLKPRPWREALAPLLQAGAGLQAAHEAGLVHCDFKPQNVLIGRDGRVRVLDFGLSQLRERTRTAPASGPAEDSLRTTLIGGTPAYMAPELFLRAEPTPRSDQFAFCVTLFEALHGVRPFTGKSYDELARAIGSGQIVTPPTDIKVPAWLRRAVLRGLSPAPEQRWPSMAALLQELARDPARKARNAALSAGAAALLAVTAFSVLERRALEAQLATRQCDAAGELSGVWDTDARQAVEQAIVGSGAAYALDTWPRVTARLDEYSAAWSAMRVDACEANRAGIQSDLLYERRLACLGQRRDDLAALVEVYREADRDVVTKAVKASFELRPLTACADPGLLLAAVAPPDDEAAASLAAAARKDLAAVRAELTTGRVKRARERITAALPAIEAAGYRPVIAEAQFLVGMVEDALGDYKAAAAGFEAALWAAEASRHDQVAAEAGVRLIFVVGYRQAKIDDTGVWQRLTAAVMERRGGPRELEGRWLTTLGIVQMRAGQLEQAAATLQSALAAIERNGNASRLEAAVLLGNLGSLAGSRGDPVAAADFSRRSLALLEGLLGPEHPDVAAVCANIGVAAMTRGDIEDARAQLERARGIYERSVGADHPEIARIDNNLATTYARSNDYRAALALQLRALAMRQRLLGPDHTDTAILEGNVADSYLHLGDPAQALVHARLAVAGQAASVGSEHARYAMALGLRGLAELGIDDTRSATTTLEQAIALLTRTEPLREHLGEARFGLARALWPRKPAEAVSLAQAARDDFTAAGPTFTREHDAVQAWLADHTP